MMDISQYDEQIIQCYNKYLFYFFNNIDSLNMLSTNNRTTIINQGFHTFSHVLSILYSIDMNEGQINSYLEKCPLLFIEYTEQVYLKQIDKIHTPSMFVYNVLLGNITMRECKSNNNKNDFIKKLIKWSQIIFFWDNNHITIDNRKYFSKNFLQPYLLLFTSNSVFSLYRVFENIQRNLSTKTNIFEVYSFLLTSFLNYFSKKNALYNEKQIEDLCFNKFMRNKEYFDEQCNDITTLKHMDGLIKWVFST